MNRTHLRSRSCRAQAGFTFIELLVVIAILSIAALVGFPALQNLLIRSKLEGFTREFSVHLVVARQEAIKQGVPVVVEFDQVRQEIFVFADVPDDAGVNDFVYDHDKAAAYPDITPRTQDYAVSPTQHGFGGPATGWALPRGNSPETSIMFATPTDSDGEIVWGFKKNPNDPDADFSPPRIVFLPDGTVADLGAVRMGDFRFPGDVDSLLCGNCFELEVENRATTRVAIKKWNHAQDKWFVQGRDKDSNEPLWQWY